MVMTADDFLTKVGNACLWSTSQSGWPRTGAQVLSIADGLITGRVIPKTVKSSKDYYICTLDHALVATYSRYRQPRHMLGPLRDVLYVDADENEQSLDLIDLDDLGHPERLTCGKRYHFIDGDYVGIYPTPETGETGTLRIRYFRSPSRLVLLAAATTVAAADFESDPLGITLEDGSVFTSGAYIDVLSSGNAHAVLAEDVRISGLAGDVVTADRSLLGSGVERGDYVSAQGTTPILPIPDHAIPWLIQLTAAKAMRQHDPDGAARADAEARELLADMTGIASPRTLSEPQSAGDTMADSVWR